MIHQRMALAGWHSSGLHSVLYYSFLNFQESDRQLKIGHPPSGSAVPGTIRSSQFFFTSWRVPRKCSTVLGKSRKPCIMRILHKIFNSGFRKTFRVSPSSNESTTGGIPQKYSCGVISIFRLFG